MTRAWNLSFAVAGLCGALLATPVAAQSTNPCAAVVVELRQVVIDEATEERVRQVHIGAQAGYLDLRIRSQERLREYEDRLKKDSSSLVDLILRDGMRDSIRAAEAGLTAAQRGIEAKSDRIAALRNRHNQLRQQLASPNCRTAGQQPVTPTDTASTPSRDPVPASTANTNADDTNAPRVTASGRPIISSFGPDQPGPADSPAAGATSTATAPADVPMPDDVVLNYDAPGLPPAGSPAPGTTSTATAPPDVLHYDGPGVGNQPPPQTQPPARTVRKPPRRSVVQQQRPVRRQAQPSGLGDILGRAGNAASLTSTPRSR